MTREEAEDYVYSSYLKAEKNISYETKDAHKRHPEFTHEMLEKMNGAPCVVVTGSKGKGSVSCMISQIMQVFGNTGLMTSPHINSFCERFRVNGIPISDEEFTTYIEQMKPSFEQIQRTLSEREFISPMGVQAALALKFFNKEETFFNVFECGKGAKYDDVNSIPHKYAVVNSIFLEHTRELGDTIEQIAEDKAHVITDLVQCAFSAKQKPEVMEVLRNRAREKRKCLKQYGVDFQAENIKYMPYGMQFSVRVGTHLYEDIKIPLLGVHQAENCALAFAVCEEEIGYNGVSERLKEIREKLTRLSWPGRMEVLCKEPFILLDACINRESFYNVSGVLKQLKINHVTAVIGIPDDKDYTGVVKEAMRIAKHIILTGSRNPHYHFTDIQQKTLLEDNDIKQNKNITMETIQKSREAIEKARTFDLPIIILGTTSLIGEVENIFH